MPDSPWGVIAETSNSRLDIQLQMLYIGLQQSQFVNPKNSVFSKNLETFPQILKTKSLGSL